MAASSERADDKSLHRMLVVEYVSLRNCRAASAHASSHRVDTLKGCVMPAYGLFVDGQLAVAPYLVRGTLKDPRL